MEYQINSLASIPFFDSAAITSLKQELPIYLSKSSGVSPNIDILEWWRLNGDSLPSWSSAAQMQPSAAAAERVFSLLNNSFGSKQNQCLEDYVETSIML